MFQFSQKWNLKPINQKWPNQHWLRICLIFKILQQTTRFLPTTASLLLFPSANQTLTFCTVPWNSFLFVGLDADWFELIFLLKTNSYIFKYASVYLEQTLRRVQFRPPIDFWLNLDKGPEPLCLNFLPVKWRQKY